MRPAGVLQTGGILDKIVEARTRSVEAAKRARPLASLRRGIKRQAPTFFDSITGVERTNIIAEVKHRSPSKGVIREDFNPVAIARSYENAGAAAISVLTEEEFFGGSLDYLRTVREAVSLPLLRKDFLIDEYQVYEAADAGADAVLLIVAILDDNLLKQLLELSKELKLDALVEVHDYNELERASRAGAKLIGVNNRDLKTFAVELDTSLRLAQKAPDGALLVSESGIKTCDDIKRLSAAGFSAFLIGEQFMRADDPGQTLAALMKG